MASKKVDGDTNYNSFRNVIEAIIYIFITTLRVDFVAKSFDVAQQNIKRSRTLVAFAPFTDAEKRRCGNHLFTPEQPEGNDGRD